MKSFAFSVSNFGESETDPFANKYNTLNIRSVYENAYDPYSFGLFVAFSKYTVSNTVFPLYNCDTKYN